MKVILLKDVKGSGKQGDDEITRKLEDLGLYDN